MDSKSSPDIIIGLWQIADMERDGSSVNIEEAAKSMLHYYENGFTTFDMADHYGSSEEIAGYFKSKYQLPDLKLYTKWVPAPGLVTEDIAEKAVVKALKRMQSEKLDLLQFHAWNYADPHWLDALYALSRLREKGLIAHIGLTNFDHIHLNMVARSGIPVVSNQLSYSLIDQRASKEMTAVCLQHQIKLFAYGTVAGGFFSEKWLGKPEPVQSEQFTWSQMKYKRFIDAAGGWDWFQSMLETLSVIAQRKNCSIATLASAYMSKLPAVEAVIVGARLGQSSHIDENKKIILISFTADELSAIKDVLSKAASIPGNCGDEYRKPPFLTASGDLSHHIQAFPKPYPISMEQNGKTKVFSGTPWESLAGYSRAVRKGNQIFVSGTTATHGDKIIGGSDTAAQTHFIIDKIEGALQSVGATLQNVVRTRIFVHNKEHWEPIARAHGERFGDIQPANTMVEAKLIGDGYLVEIEAYAIVD
jgi:aryl-alcohol dehydrogenase-like predicted oxidoreductase/enamine deaminase RidA (YjgF/YER057c/UK114 family)